MSRDTACIYTIGYGGRDFAAFAALLHEHQIEYLIDVRSQPYSRHQIEFNRETLRDLLAGVGVQYVFIGDALGGRPADPTCYIDGKVDYLACRSKPWFQSGIDRLQNALRDGRRLALMCSEGKPEMCHRTKLVAEDLVARGVDVRHIDEGSRLASHQDIMRRITGGQLSLLPGLDSQASTSRKRFAS